MTTSTYHHAIPEGIDRSEVAIVGGGTAGLALASRLSESSDISILVLEAGVDRSSDQSVTTPSLNGKLQGNPEYHWDLQTLPQAALGNRSIQYTRGKGLGGTSLLHRNMMTFPSKSSIDCWADLGNSSWTFESMQSYYRKFHTFHTPSDAVKKDLGLDYLDEELHGKTGPIQVSFGEYQTEFDKAWASSFKALGYKATKDPISGLCVSGHNTAASIDPSSMTRSFAGNAYLPEQVKKRPNLQIITGVTVEKIVFNENKHRSGLFVAKGVSFRDRDGKISMASATEVILCAGVVQSPQILELSGIGSRELLTSHGIETMVDLPRVGENLQDHAIVGQHRTGPLAMATYSAAFLPRMGFLGEQGEKELRQLFEQYFEEDGTQVASFGHDSSLKKQYELIRSIVEDPQQSSIHYLFAPVQLNAKQSPAPVSAEARAADYITLFASLSHPFSRGSVRIVSNKPTDKSAVDPRYFSHPLDAKIIARHLPYLDVVVATEPLASLLKKDGRRIPTDVNLQSLDTTRRLIENGFTTYHPCGTCVMMPREIGGVIDQNLKVYGLQNVRVVDASVFPMIPCGSIQSSVYAVAERAADMIKSDRAQLRSQT